MPAEISRSAGRIRFYNNWEGPMAELTLQGDDNDDTRSPAERRIAYAGAALILLAFLGPWLALKFGAALGRGGGRQVGSMTVLLFLLGFIAWLLTHKRSNLVQAWARAVVGVLMCVASTVNAVQIAREELAAEAFLRVALEFTPQSLSAWNEADAKLNDIDLEAYTVPEALSSTAALASAQAELQRYRALVTERHLAIGAYVAEGKAFVDTAPQGVIHSEFQTEWSREEMLVRKIDADSQAARTEYANVMAELFAWAHANAGSLGMRDGQLLQTPEQRGVLLSLKARLAQASTGVARSDAYEQEQIESARVRQARWRQNVEAALAR
jgi:hypothetical protein